MHLFDTVSLKLFVSVCEEKSIAMAAERDGIVPSAVSKRISVMEERLGTQLLERGRRGIEPTPAGEVLLRHAREIMHCMERMSSELSNFSEGIQGHVCIFASISAAQFLQKDLAEFLHQHEKVRVSVVEKVTTDIVRGVDEGRADFGVCWGEANLHHLQSKPYRRDTIVLVVPCTHVLASREKVTFSEILDYEIVDIIVGSIVQTRMKNEAAAVGKSVRCRIQVTTFDAACQAAADGLGVTLVPRGLVSTRNDLVTVPIADAWTQRRFVICTKDDEQLSLPARMLIQRLSANAAESEA